LERISKVSERAIGGGRQDGARVADDTESAPDTEQPRSTGSGTSKSDNSSATSVSEQNEGHGAHSSLTQRNTYNNVETLSHLEGKAEGKSENVIGCPSKSEREVFSRAAFAVKTNRRGRLGVRRPITKESGGAEDLAPLGVQKQVYEMRRPVKYELIEEGMSPEGVAEYVDLGGMEEEDDCR
jgi:hypothetical protein